MIPILPRTIANKGILVYLISLSLVTLAFFSHAMSIEYILLGIMWVSGFFLLSSKATIRWRRMSPTRFVKKVFWVAFGVRVAWVIFSYFFYISKTGEPFEFGAADALGYHEEAKWLAGEDWSKVFDIYKSKSGVSDTGYPIYLITLYKIFGPSIIVARLMKALFGALTCILIYKLSKRNIGETAGRMAAIFTVFMPNLVMYCGMHLKETEMVFLIVSFLERADNLIRTKQFNIRTIALPTLLALSLFFFRTVLGAVAVLSLFAGLLFTSTKVSSRARRTLLIVLGIAAIGTFVGTTIATEVEGYWELRFDNEARKIASRTARGAQWAKYATGAVLAPMEFVMPLATMVDTDQENQQILHGGNFVKNFMGIFVLLALFGMIFKEKCWRDSSLILAFTAGYLLVIALSGYGNAERFLFPAIPCLMILAAYGLSHLSSFGYQLVKYWYIVVAVMEFGWAFFKLGSRGLF